MGINRMMSHHQPTESEVRARIESIKDESYRYGFMYQHLICGRISEMCGRYAPLGNSFVEMEFEVPIFIDKILEGKKVTVVELTQVPAVMFIAKTAKRGGRLRPCAVPLDPKYEPWAQPMLDYFKEVGNDYPFMFHENFAHSVRYAQWEAEDAFDGFMWPMVKYTRTEKIPYDPKMIITKRYGDTGYEEFLVELSDGKRYWTYSKKFVAEPDEVLARWKPFRSHCLRKRRIVTLTMDYEFDGIDAAYFGGWTESGRDKTIPVALKHYLHMELGSAKESMDLLKKMSKRYFYKLCKTQGE